MPTEGPQADLDSRQSQQVEGGNRPLPSTPDEVDPPIIPDPNPKRERRGDEVVLRDFDKIQEKTPITVDPAHLKIAVVGVLAIVAVAGLVGWMLGKAPAPHKPAQPIVTATAVQKPVETERKSDEPAAGDKAAEQNLKKAGQDRQTDKGDAKGTQPADDEDFDQEARANSAVTARVLPLPTNIPAPAPVPNEGSGISPMPAPVPAPAPVPTPPPPRRPTTGQSPTPRGIEMPARQDVTRRMAADTKEIETSIRKAAEAAERAMFQLWPPLAVTSCDYSCISPDGVCLPDNPPPKKTAPIVKKGPPAETIADTNIPAKPAPVKVEQTTPKPNPTNVAATKPAPANATTTKTATTGTVAAKPAPAKPAPTKPTPVKTVKEPEPRKYSVQVRSFKERELADQHADLLKSKGYNPYVVTFTDPSGVEWFRVRMGKFDSPAEASAFSRELNAKEAEQSIPVEAK